jgi:hypothetical protein
VSFRAVDDFDGVHRGSIAPRGCRLDRRFESGQAQENLVG